MSSLICACGKEKASTQKKICDDCRKENKREKNRRDQQAYRDKHGSAVKRGIYCSMCKGIKEHQERGYCLACERERYKERDKPDCATCGAIKENPRDAYCNSCKREKARIKSIEEGRREKNSVGRKSSCSICGKEKEQNYLNESCCRTCKHLRVKLNRSKRTEEQILKENVRRLTWMKMADGTLIRLPCEICGTDKDVQAHHDDYNRPLEVRWLCRKHHKEHHDNEKNKDKK